MKTKGIKEVDGKNLCEKCKQELRERIAEKALNEKGE